MFIDPKNEKPVVSITVNVDDIMLEAVTLIRNARTEIEGITAAVHERVNASLGAVRFKDIS
jgi:hypothetical protein